MIGPDDSTGAGERDGVGARVRDFYEQHPYPPPLESLDAYRRRWQDPSKRRAEFHLSWPAQAYREDFSILIAGCGTSQAAKHALRWPAARVTGIDFSAISVRCTEGLKQKYALGNLTLHQLPLERVAELGVEFDQIVCTGVLHHLPDPDAGLKALRAVLAPGGAMQLMVYAPYGRTGIYMLQDFCRLLGIRATPQEIGDLMAALERLPPGHPLETLLREAPDFRDEAALADALLHPQDRAYSVPQLFEFLKRGGFEFGRWVRNAPYFFDGGVAAHIPQAVRISRLAPVEQYAALELFRGTMIRHSALVHRNDEPDAAVGSGLDGSNWRACVPIRLPETVCVLERLPPGSAAVLINRAHTYKDLYLPIDARQKRWFDAIDGTASIGDILERTGPAPHEPARAFFERLWWYDQVVFDRSRAALG